MITNTFEKIVLETFNSYENVNILLRRNDKINFQHYGRIEDENDATKLDNDIEKYLIKHKIKFGILNVENIEIMWKNLNKYIKINN